MGDIPTATPTNAPTVQPTPEPTPNPTPNPTNAPTVSPTKNPTNAPTANPTLRETVPPPPPTGGGLLDCEQLQANNLPGRDDSIAVFVGGNYHGNFVSVGAGTHVLPNVGGECIKV